MASLPSRIRAELDKHLGDLAAITADRSKIDAKREAVRQRHMATLDTSIADLDAQQTKIMERVAMLAARHKDHLADGLDLPHGRLSIVRRPAALQLLVPEAEAIARLTEDGHEDLVVTKTMLDKRALKQSAADFPDLVAVVQGEDVAIAPNGLKAVRVNLAA